MEKILKIATRELEHMSDQENLEADNRIRNEYVEHSLDFLLAEQSRLRMLGSAHGPMSKRVHRYVQQKMHTMDAGDDNVNVLAYLDACCLSNISLLNYYVQLHIHKHGVMDTVHHHLMLSNFFASQRLFFEHDATLEHQAFVHSICDFITERDFCMYISLGAPVLDPGDIILLFEQCLDDAGGAAIKWLQVRKEQLWSCLFPSLEQTYWGHELHAIALGDARRNDLL